MNSKANVHIGDFGTVFKFTILNQDEEILDVSTVSGIFFVFEKPDTSQIEKDGDIFTDGKDGIVFYTLESGFIDTAGYWKIQVRTTSPTANWNSTVVRFKVEEEL